MSRAVGILFAAAIFLLEPVPATAQCTPCDGDLQCPTGTECVEWCCSGTVWHSGGFCAGTTRLGQDNTVSGWSVFGPGTVVSSTAYSMSGTELASGLAGPVIPVLLELPEYDGITMGTGEEVEPNSYADWTFDCGLDDTWAPTEATMEPGGLPYSAAQTGKEPCACRNVSTGGGEPGWWLVLGALALFMFRRRLG